MRGGRGRGDVWGGKGRGDVWGGRGRVMCGATGYECACALGFTGVNCAEDENECNQEGEGKDPQAKMRVGLGGRGSVSLGGRGSVSLGGRGSVSLGAEGQSVWGAEGRGSHSLFGVEKKYVD